MNAELRKLLGWSAAALTAGAITGAVTRRLLSYQFRDRVVVITGGSRGLGLVMARQLAAEGARLALCARNPEELDRARTELEQSGAEVFTQVCDLRRSEQISEFLSAVRQQLGPIDVLINNAGIIQVGPIESMTEADVEEAMKIHFWAVYHTTQAVLPEMRRRGAGRIVNIASIGGEVAVPHLLPYCASKFALVGYSQSLRLEVAKDGIVVTTISPGLMRTGSARNALFKGQHRAEYAWFSVSASLPFVTISAESAARQVLDACRMGRAHRTLSLPAKGAVLLNSLAPNLVAGSMDIVNRLLPAFGGIGQQRRTGEQSTSSWSPSPLTVLNERASQKNNEILPNVAEISGADDAPRTSVQDSQLR